MKAKKIIIAVVAILVILGGTFAGLWFFTDVLNFMKPEKETTSEKVKKSEEAIDIEEALHLEGARFSKYSEFLEKEKDILTGSYKANLNLSANVKLSELDSEISNIINKSKITLTSNLDTENQKAQNTVGLYSNNSEVLTLDFVTNGTTVGVKCKDLYDKYLTFSMEDLTEYLENESDIADINSLMGIMNNMYNPVQINPYELLYISDEDLEHFDEVYRDGYSALIPTDCYSTKDDVEVKVNGQKVVSKAYYITLNGKEFYDFVSNFGETVKDDSVLTRVLTEKINLFMEAAGADKVKEREVQELIDQLVDEMISDLDDIQDYEDSAVQIAVYTSDDELVKIEFNSIADTDDMDDVATMAALEFSDSKNTFTIYDGEAPYIVLTNDIKNDSDEEIAGTLKLSIDGSSVGSLTYDIVSKDAESKFDISVKVPSYGISADINIETNGDITEEEVEISGSIGFTFGSDSIKIDFDGTMEYTDDVSIPSFSSSNSVNVLKLSDSELQTELTKIMEKAAEVLPDRLKLIGIDINAEDIYTDPNAEPAEPTGEEENNENSENTENNENSENAENNENSENVENSENSENTEENNENVA